MSDVPGTLTEAEMASDPHRDGAGDGGRPGIGHRESARPVPRRTVALALAGALALGACVSMSQPDPVASLDQIAGRWQGLMSWPGNFDRPFYLTIAPDGRLYAAWGANQVWGEAVVENGKARFEMRPPLLEGDLKLYGSGGARMLVMQELWGTFIVNLTPQP